MSTGCLSATSERPPGIGSDIIEELASPEESLFIQLVVSHYRGLGWNTTHHPALDCPLAVHEAYTAEAGTKLVARSELQDREMTMKENAQEVHTLLIRVAEKISSPSAMLSSFPKSQSGSTEQMPTTTAPHKMIRGTASPNPFITEEDHRLSLQNKAQQVITTCDLESMDFSGSGRCSAATESFAPLNKRTGANKRALPDKESAEIRTVEASKRTKNVPVVSEVKASPDQTPYGCPRRTAETTTQSITTFDANHVLATVTTLIGEKCGPGRRKHRMEGYTLSSTKELGFPASSTAAEKVVTPALISTLPQTPASRTRRSEIFRNIGFESARDSGRVCDEISAVKVTSSRAPRRCMRCVHFGGSKAFDCKGRGGQKNCIFFSPRGKPVEG
jgi:hypothetical protein